VLLRLCEASRAGNGPLDDRRVEEGCREAAGLEEMEEDPEEQQEMGTTGMKQQQEKKMPSQCTSSSSAASAALATSRATVPAVAGQAEEPCPPLAVAALA